MEPCIISCSTPAFVAAVVTSLQPSICDIMFAWSCTVRQGSGSLHDAVVALGAPGIFFEFRRSAGPSDESFVSLPARSLQDVTSHSFTISACRAVVRFASDASDTELNFPTSDIAQRFAEHLEGLLASGSAHHTRSSSLTSTATTRRSDAGDGRQNRTREPCSPDALLRSADTDYFHLGSNKAFCGRARHKWAKFMTHMKAQGKEAEQWHMDDDNARDKGLSSVLLSVDAQLGQATHELAVVTDVALMIVKRRDPSIVKAFLPIAGIEALQMASVTKTGATGGSQVEWDIMVLIDLQIPVTTLSTDLKLRLDNRNKNLLVASLSRQFEALRLQRLPTKVHHDALDKLFWRKRTLLETKVIRVANKLKQSVAFVTGKDDPVNASRVDEQIGSSLREVVTEHSEQFIGALCTQIARDDPEELAFTARSLWGVARRCNAVQQVLFSVVLHEISRISMATTTRGFSGGFFRGWSLADALLSEFMMHTGEQYLRILLAQMFEEFAQSTASDKTTGGPSVPSPAVDKGLLMDHEFVRYTRDVATALFEASHNDALFPEPIKEILAMIDIAASATHSGSAAHVFGDDFVIHMFLGRAIESPQSHGLVSDELSVSQLRNLRIISKLLQHVAVCATNGHAVWFADHPLDDRDVTVVQRVIASRPFATAQEQLASHVASFVERQRRTTTAARKELEAVLRRMHQGASRSAVVRPPLLPSDVRVLRTFHALLERRTAGLMCAAFKRWGASKDQKRSAVSFLPSETTFAAPEKSAADKRKALEAQNATLAERVSVLEASAKDASVQWSAAVQSLRETQVLLQGREEELSRLRKRLRVLDPQSFPTVAEIAQSEGLPAMMQESPGAHVVERPATGPTLPAPLARYSFSSPIGGRSYVFGCPMDSYANRLFSPTEGAL